MKKYDFLWVLILLAIIAFLLYPATNAIFNANTAAHPYIMAFTKFCILATMGELLAMRVVTGDWKRPIGLIYRAIVWGLIGMLISLIFTVYGGGVGIAIKTGLLPSFGGSFGPAFLISLIMNTTFAPMFMTAHRITDTYIDLGQGNLGQIFNVKLSDVVAKIDWNGLISFVMFKTIPLFWIPAHTITFMLPPQYRVVFAAFLSIALGGILSFAKRQKQLA
jgi:hypothetical protein